MSAKAKQNLSAPLIDEESGPEPASDTVQEIPSRIEEKLSLSSTDTSISTSQSIEAANAYGKPPKISGKCKTCCTCFMIVSLIVGGVVLLFTSFAFLRDFNTTPTDFALINGIAILSLMGALAVMKGASDFCVSLIEKRKIVALTFFLVSVFGICFTDRNMEKETPIKLLLLGLIIIQLISGLSLIVMSIRGKSDPLAVKPKAHKPKTVEEIYDAFG